MNSVLNSALRQVARKLSVDYKLAECIYDSYWKFVREYAESLPLREVTNREELDSIVTNFNIPYIGKLYVEYERIEKYHKRLKFYENAKAKKNQASGLSGAGQ